MKLTSLATVHKHITTLEKKGFIRRGYNQSRSIEIVQLPKSVKDQVMERRFRNCLWWGASRPADRWKLWKNARLYRLGILRAEGILLCCR